MGRIFGSFGVLGWIKVHPYTEYVESLLDYPVWWLDQGDGKWLEIKVVECHVHTKIVIARLDGCVDRTEAILLRDTQIAIPRSHLPLLSDGAKNSYYWSDLINLKVVNLKGEELGKVIGLIETGANDVLQVENSKGEQKDKKLIPFIHQVIVKVDSEKNHGRLGLRLLG